MDSRRAGGGNRMMTSTTLQTNDIWSKTIGHDPHAGDAEAAEDAAARERQEERARGVMELARLDAIKQGGSSRGDNFAQSLFWGLKRKAPPRGYEMAPVESSSSSGSSSDDDDDDAARAAKRRRADLAAFFWPASRGTIRACTASRPGVAPHPNRPRLVLTLADL